jgi:hypothetical protein
MKFIFFTFDGLSLPIAQKLQEEGQEVLVCQIANANRVKIKETPEQKEKRLQIGNGLVRKKDADLALEVLLKMPESQRKEYFVINDFNNQYYYGEKLIAAGYQGFLARKEDAEFEQDRFKAKEFVKKNYPYLNIPETHEFKTIKDGIDFLKKERDFYVLKGNYEESLTVVPQAKNIDDATEELVDILQRDKSVYEKQGFILERKIRNGVEFIPEAVFYNGVLLGIIVDIENKYLGSGNTGFQTGCAIDTNFFVSLDHPAYEMFLKPLEKFAQNRKGLFVGDANVIWDIERQKFYFLEFCQNRWGYSAIFSELSLFDKVSDYFEKITSSLPLYSWQKNQPIIAASVRIFNLLTNPYNNKIAANLKAKIKNPKFVWLWDFKKEGKDIVNVGHHADIAVITGRGYNLYEAVEDCYENLENNFYFPEMYYRPKEDFFNENYPNSIVGRYNFFINFNWEKYLKEYGRRTNALPN